MIRVSMNKLLKRSVRSQIPNFQRACLSYQSNMVWSEGDSCPAYVIQLAKENAPQENHEDLVKTYFEMETDETIHLKVPVREYKTVVAAFESKSVNSKVN